MNSLLKEFKQFAVKGPVVDLAVGVIIGAAFGKIVSSLVNDVVMPAVGILLGGVNFSNLVFVIRAASEGQAEVAVRYGAFLQTVVDFLIVAWAIFVAIKLINKLKRETPPETAPAAPKEDIQLLTEIRDLLRK